VKPPSDTLLGYLLTPQQHVQNQHLLETITIPVDPLII
jgi:hypothetical protein